MTIIDATNEPYKYEPPIYDEEFTSSDLAYFREDPSHLHITDAGRAALEAVAWRLAPSHQKLEEYLGIKDVPLHNAAQILENGIPEGINSIYQEVVDAYDEIKVRDVKTEHPSNSKPFHGHIMIAHELKTPMTIIVPLTEPEFLLQLGIPEGTIFDTPSVGSVDEERRGIILNFQEQLKAKTLELVHKLRQVDMYTRLLKGQNVEMIPLGLDDMLDEVTKIGVGEIQFQNGTHIDLREIVAAFPNIGSVVQELINNAVISNGKRIRREGIDPQDMSIKIETYEDNKSKYIVVRDTGVGMSGDTSRRPFIPLDKYEPRFNDAFRSSGDPGIQPVGMGLGLPIAKLLVEREGCDLILENNPEGGVSGIIIIPKN